MTVSSLVNELDRLRNGRKPVRVATPNGPHDWYEFGEVFDVEETPTAVILHARLAP